MSIKITDDSIRPLLDSYFDSSTTIENLRRLSGGASRETWAFTASTDEARHDLVLRRDHGSNPGSTDRATEYELLKVVEAGGVLVPEVKFVLPPEADLGEGFVMNMIAGETIPRKILRDDEFRHSLGRAAALRSTEFTWDSAIKNFEQVLLDAAQRR
jgi:aminoglycoside phosphotransferase (APT) family kinase protein